MKVGQKVKYNHQDWWVVREPGDVEITSKEGVGFEERVLIGNDYTTVLVETWRIEE